MWDLATLEKINQQAARQAKRERQTPLLLDAGKGIERPLRQPIPHFGRYVPKGWKPAGEVWFVDKTGWGRDDEPALSIDQFLGSVHRYADRHPDHGIAVVEEGPFQVYVAAFRPDGREDGL